MSLEKYAKQKPIKLTETVTTKLTKEDYDRYIQHLEKLNLTESEGTRYLILEELAEAKKRRRSQTNRNESKEEKDQPTKTSRNYGGFSSKPWQVNGEIPCVFCGIWIKSRNFARHLKIKDHGYANAKMYFKAHGEEAMRMKRERT